MELLLIRHGLPVRRELSEGIADPELAPVGHEQARLLAAYLASERFDALYSSPLQRARQTAAPLAATLGLPVGIVAGVAEADRYSSEYVPVEELKAADDPRWHALVRGEYAEGEESLEAFQQRVVIAVDALIAAHAGHRIAVACHAGVINTYLCHVVGLPASKWLCHPGYTSIHRVIASRSGHRNVVSMNETAHLRGTGLEIGPHTAPEAQA